MSGEPTGDRHFLIDRPDGSRELVSANRMELTERGQLMLYGLGGRLVMSYGAGVWDRCAECDEHARPLAEVGVMPPDPRRPAKPGRPRRPVNTPARGGQARA